MSQMARQLPLTLPHAPEQRFDTFVDAPAGVIAQLHGWLAPVAAALYLQGGKGSGKSHLALAVCAEAAARSQPVQYLPLAAFAGQLSRALPTPQAGGRYVLDGLEAVAGQRDEEIALFDFHNAARALGAGLLYCAREVPDRLELALPDLQSRLEQCLRLRLETPDDARRARILRQRAAHRGLHLDDAVIDWLLRHGSRDLSHLAQLLARLDTAALQARRKVTLPFLRQVLTDAGGLPP